MYHKTFVESNAYCHILILWHVVHFSYAFMIGRLNNKSRITSVFACQKFIVSKIEFPKLKITMLFQKKNEVCNFENSKSMNRNFDENQGFSIDFRPRISLHFPPKSGFFHGNPFFSKLEQKIKNRFLQFLTPYFSMITSNLQLLTPSDG